MILGSKIDNSTKIWHPELVNIYGATIGKNCKIGTFVEIGDGVVIGNNCKIQSFSFIPSGVIIGDNVFIGPHVVFTNDKYPKAVGDWKLMRTIVKDGASIGAAAVILPGIMVGENALIGAGAIITKDVKSNQKII